MPARSPIDRHARRGTSLATTVALLAAAGAAPASGATPAPGALAAASPAQRYRWPRRAPGYEPLAARIPAPAGFARVDAPPGSYAAWLRELPLLPAGTPVRSYAGRTILAGDHPALAAVVDLDLSPHDRQQCVDTIMRLRGEYLFAAGRADAASFCWAGGRRFGFADYRQGLRPVRDGRRWTFARRAAPTRGHGAFRAYLEHMFSWTGTVHQLREPSVPFAQLRAGDFFLQPGSPGHAVVILDLARSGDGRTLRALIGQGFIPAQDLHVLRAPGGSPWFTLDPRQPLRTPRWRPFSPAELRRFAR